MKKMRLTKRTIEATPPPDTGRDTYQDTGDRYLHLVKSQSTTAWRYIRKVKGRAVFLTLGFYPEMTPDQARRESLRTSAAYTQGDDPQQAKQQARSITTWTDLFGWYIEEHSRPHKRTWKTDVAIERRYCAAWRPHPADSLSAARVSTWHKSIGRDHGKIAADRALGLVRSVFNKAIAMGVITAANPTTGVSKFYKSPEEYGRARFLSAEEVGRLFTALDDYHDQTMADFFRLCIYTGARRGNIQQMRWADFNRASATWQIPGLVSKNGEPMSIALLPEAVDILNRLYERRRSQEWVFPSRRLTPKTPYMSEPKFAWARICKAAQLSHVRMHDLRRTLGSWMAINGASLAIIGRTLGHKSVAATLIYARLNDQPVREQMGAAVGRMLLEAKRPTEKAVTT